MLFCLAPDAGARTIVIGGSMTATEHVKVVDTFTITGLNPAQLTAASKVTYNAPVFVSDSISGFSQAVTGLSLTPDPSPASTSGQDDQFGNQYDHYEWSLNGYGQSTLVVTVTAEFDCTATGSPTPTDFTDPYPVSAAGMSQYLQPTGMAQSGNPQIAGTAQTAVAGATTEAAAVGDIMDFIKTHVSDGPNSATDAVSTLNAGTGVCVNRANLALALLRASGIPARYVNGIVSDDPYDVDFTDPDNGPATMQTGWYAQEAHSWIEVYYQQEGVWVGYDPYLNFGFVDQRHVKSGIALDSDVVGQTTGGLSGLFQVVSLNSGVSVQAGETVSYTSLADSGSYTFRTLEDRPGGSGVYVLARDMVNAPPTPTPTPGPTPTPAQTATATPVPNATATPSPGASATATPVPAASNGTAGQYLNLTAEAGSGCSYVITGTVADAGNGTPLAGADISLDGQQIPLNARGTFSLQAANGTHVISVTAPGYRNVTVTVTVAGANVTQDMRLSPASDANATAKPRSPGFELIIAISGLLAAAAYRHGRA